MKIGFPAYGQSKNERGMLSSDFTMNGLIGVFDTELETTHVYKKDDLSMSLMEWLVNKDISTIISPEIQVMALNVFRELDIKVYKAASSMLSLNIELYLNNCLPLYSTEELYEAGAGACGSSNCGSCSSSSCN